MATTTTLLTLVTRVSARLKDPNFTAVSKLEVVAVINDAIDFYSNSRFAFNEFKETVTLNIGDMVVPALTTNTDPDRIFQTDGMVINYSSAKWPLMKVSSDEMDRLDVQGQGMPYAWTWRNGGYEVYYRPDVAYDLIIRGLKSYAPLVLDTDHNDFTDNAGVLIMNETLSRLFAQFRQDDKMEGYFTAAALQEFKSLQTTKRRLVATGRIQVQEM